MSKFKFEDYKGKYVMNCKTEQEDEEFRKLMHDNDMKWANGDSYLKKSIWKYYKENACYNFNNGRYAKKDFFINEGYTILEWSDFTSECQTFTKLDLKVGDFLVTNLGYLLKLFNDEILLTEDGKHELLSKIDIDDISSVHRPTENFHHAFNYFGNGMLVFNREQQEKQQIVSIKENIEKLEKEIEAMKKQLCNFKYV